MNDLLDDPEGFYDHVRRYTASVASALAFGHRGPTFHSFWGHVRNPPPFWGIQSGASNRLLGSIRRDG